jgi:uncharacterized membrane protein YphA (DoxX/SURF4 family)
MAILRKIRTVFTWLLQILVGVAFVPIGLAKFSHPMWINGFERWGYAPWFRILIGVVEAGCGVMLLVPRLTSYAAVTLAAVMIGAMWTHAMAHQPWWRPLPHFLLLTLLATLRWRSRWKGGSTAPAGVTGRS